MRQCYHCGSRMVFADDDGPMCLACGRSQLSYAWMPEPLKEEWKPAMVAHRCQECGVTFQAAAWQTARAYCSRSCRSRANGRKRPRGKPWRELQMV